MTDSLPNWPRLLSAEFAASYVGIGETSFLAGVSRGDWPKPLRLGRRTVWDRAVLDERVDQIGGRLSGEDGGEWMGSLENVEA